MSEPIDVPINRWEAMKVEAAKRKRGRERERRITDGRQWSRPVWIGRARSLRTMAEELDWWGKRARLPEDLRPATPARRRVTLAGAAAALRAAASLIELLILSDPERPDTP